MKIMEGGDMTSETKGYQGYANYETWACALWIDNEQSLYNERREKAQYSWDTSEDAENRSEDARDSLAADLQAWVEEMSPDLGATMFSDLLNSALAEIDYAELADTWLNEEINENGDGGYEVAK